MFRYVSDVNNLSHYIIRNFCLNFDTAVDATLGNGYDTDFLSSLFHMVYAFDIQESAISKYSERTNEKIRLIHDSHEYLENYITCGVDCITYNLGFLPGGDKNITTRSSSTLISLESGLRLLKSGGIITIAIYSGHEEGTRESAAVRSWTESLPKNKYGVLLHSFVNRTNNPPSLIVVEKK